MPQLNKFMLTSIGFAALTLTFSQTQVKSAGAANPNKASDVVVSNTTAQPVPVQQTGTWNVNVGTPTVNLAGTPTVNLAGTPSVTLAGAPAVSVSNVVSVRDVDAPARNPFQATRFVNWAASTGGTVSTLQPPVPADKRLVIEHVNIRATLRAGVKPLVQVTAVSNNAGAAFFQPLSFQGNWGAWDEYLGDSTGRIYADPGTNVTVTAYRSDNASDAEGFWYTLTGYYISVP